MPRPRRRSLLLAWGLVLGGALVLLFAEGPLRRLALSLLLFLDILSSYVTGSQFNAAALLTPAPAVVESSFALEGGETLRVTRYSPSDGPPKAGVLLVNGAVAGGNEDEGIVRLADALARIGFVVALPELESLKSARMDPQDVPRLVALYAALQEDPAFQGVSWGLAGICFGASLAILAAADAAVREDAAFVALVIPYADLKTYIIDVLTHTTVREGGVEPWVPREDVWWGVQRALIGLLAEEEEQARLMALLEEHAAYPAWTASPLALTDGEQVGLSAEARALLTLLAARDRAVAETVLAQLPASLHETLALLSPAHRLAELQAPLFLFHSTTDSVIPVEHSHRLAKTASATVPVHLHISELLQHTKLVVAPSNMMTLLAVLPSEGWRLLDWTMSLLAAAGL